MITKEQFSTTCIDGVTLKGILLIPEKAKGVIQFNCGAAAKKEFYLPFLEYLAENGYICCLWDYRGSGESAPKKMSECEYYFHEYGTKDMPAIKNYLNKRFPEKPFFIFGHSAGGQLVGFMDNLEGVHGMINFAVSTGYLPYMPFSYRMRSAYFFFIFTPLSIFFNGYLKAKKYGYMEDLPKNVVQEWKGWCLKKNYFFDAKFYGKSIPKGQFGNYQFPIHVFWTPDDTISNEKNINNYWSHINSNKGIEFTKLNSKDFHVKEIGHFGFFKKHMKNTLWEKTLHIFDNYLNK